MQKISLAEAKPRLSELVTLAASGETVLITRRGKPVARLTAIVEAREPIDIDALRALSNTMLPQPESVGDFMRRMRDDERF